MFLLTALLIAIVTAASPIEDSAAPLVTLPIAKRIHDGGGLLNLVKQDQARAVALKKRSAIPSGKEPDSQDGNDIIRNQAISYMAEVGVGTPPEYYNLIVDTGSANTWIGASKPYVHTSTSRDTGEDISITYGTGLGSASFFGELWLDTVALGSHLDITQQSIGVASSTNGFNTGVDGILGIGPADLTVGSLIFNPLAATPTIPNNLYEQGAISEDVFSICFASTGSLDQTNGEITFGGTDFTKYTGSINYTPITSTSPASSYWGIDVSITYGDDTILSQTAGIVDTRTTLILIASDAYEAYQSVTGAVEDPATSMLSLTTSQYDKLQNLSFNIDSKAYTLTPNAQIWPRALNNYVGGSRDKIYSVVSNIGSPSGQGLDFINGQVFLERFYSVFDAANRRVGLATTPYTDANIN